MNNYIFWTIIILLFIYPIYFTWWVLQKKISYERAIFKAKLSHEHELVRYCDKKYTYLWEKIHGVELTGTPEPLDHQLIGMMMRIIYGKGKDQVRKISKNKGNRAIPCIGWDVLPDSTSVIEILTYTGEYHGSL